MKLTFIILLIIIGRGRVGRPRAADSQLRAAAQPLSCLFVHLCIVMIMIIIIVIIMIIISSSSSSSIMVTVWSTPLCGAMLVSFVDDLIIRYVSNFRLC